MESKKEEIIKQEVKENPVTDDPKDDQNPDVKVKLIK
jgi:hypothetical protein